MTIFFRHYQRHQSLVYCRTDVGTILVSVTEQREGTPAVQLNSSSFASIPQASGCNVMHNNAALIVVVAPPNGVPQIVRGMGASFFRAALGLFPGAWLG